MANAFDTMRQAMAEAKQTIRAADEAADSMASMLRGRLRRVDGHVLKALKRELQQFDATARTWKS